MLLPPLIETKKGASLLHRNFTRRNKIVMLQNLELRAPVHWFQTSENNRNTLAYSVSDGSAEFPWQLASKRVSLTAPTVSNICKTEAKKNKSWKSMKRSSPVRSRKKRVWSVLLKNRLTEKCFSNCRNDLATVYSVTRKDKHFDPWSWAFPSATVITCQNIKYLPS